MIQTLSQHRRLIAYHLFLIFLISIAPPSYAEARNNYAYVYSNPEIATPKEDDHRRISESADTQVHVGMIGEKKNNVDKVEKFDIGGPSQPETSTFKSIGTNDMVNLFTGDFSYNIPLMDVGGYPVNIFYDGNISMEQEASWVGLGWNINPGTISRNMRGVPDDFDGTDLLTQTQDMKPNRTWGLTAGVNIELVGVGALDMFSGSAGISLGISFNNYLGPALDLGLKGTTGFSLAGKSASEKSARLGGSLGVNIGSRSGVSISPSVSLTSNHFLSSNKVTNGLSLSTSFNSRTGIKALHISDQMSFNKYSASVASTNISFARPSYMPVIRMPLTNTSASGNFQLGTGIFGVYGSVQGEVFYQKSEVVASDRVQRKPLVGYLYYQKAKSNPNAVMDFSRLNDNSVTPNTPIISAPQYSYDVFSIQGEGTGGSIRAYRNDLGYVRDNETRSKDKNISAGADVGPVGHFGGNFNTISTPTVIGDWKQNNKLRNGIGFQEASGTFENVYFRSPNETSVLTPGQFNKIGGDSLVRYVLGGTSANPSVEAVLQKYNNQNVAVGTTNIISTPHANDRKKRTQVTSFFTAAEASDVGLDKWIRSYRTDSLLSSQNTLKYDSIQRTSEYRKPHHISQMNVTEQDGRRYIYGIPVYNIVQRDYTFTIDNTQILDASTLEKVTFDSSWAKVGSPLLQASSPRDGYLQVTETPAYAHSFLLSGLLSADYVDVTSNGITEDDLGDAVKFNYTRIKQSGQWAVHKWRTPLSTNLQANFNAGSRTQVKDDKGIISYGERESWYMHSIESKTMIAVFTTSNRSDGKGATSHFSGINSGENSLKKLDRIDLYSKADLKKNGIATAKPIKTVHFKYNYSLCSGTPDNTSGGGKLTLEEISFTFNGQNRSNKNKYVFGYTDGGNGNPVYEFNAIDRWGNYKPKTMNPQTLRNQDYPYSIQDKAQKATIDQNSSAWALKKILLPSGGQIEVTYESDDYAFVQDRRAASMMEIKGFGSSSSSFSDKLYDNSGPGIVENNHVFIKVPEACINKNEVFQKYLQGFTQLSVKLSVRMPDGYEQLPMYGAIADYGVYDATTIWVKLHNVNGISPLSLTAVEYLREQLPGQAFTGYDVSGDPALSQIAQMFAGMFDGVVGAFKDPLKFLRGRGKAKQVDVTKSFARLSDPDGFKYGGGNRVKRVKLKDNWQAMTQQYTSEYGQEYNYTTTEVFNGASRTISSGVASYEPAIGGEENPFQSIVQIADRLPLGPASYGAIEMPMLDAFFPAPQVGYSKVTVKSLRKGPVDTTKKWRSAIGKQVTEFYTAKDFPVTYSHTALNPSESDKVFHAGSVLSFFYKYAIDSRAISQGFLVATNDMHGKMKSQSSYAATDTLNRVNYTENFYRNTGKKGMQEKFDFVHAAEGGVVKEGVMGIDIELMTDVREFSVKSSSVEIQGQAELFPVVFPFWLPFIWGVVGETEDTYRAVTTTKVISYHSILDSVIAIDKGSQVSTKNLVFDSETGNVVVTRTNNEFKQPIYNVSYPAYWAYGGMGLAYKNINALFEGINFYDGKITNGGFNFGNIESGDELLLIKPGTSPSGCVGVLQPTQAKRLWAFDKNKNKQSLTSTTTDFVFIDSVGNLYSKDNVSFRIIRSGKRNLLTSQVSTVTTMMDPVVLNAGIRRITFTGNNKVVNATAIEYREKWQTDYETLRKTRFDTVTINVDGYCYVKQISEVFDCNGLWEDNLNPYLKGLVGNFRTLRSNIFYGDRLGSISNPTNVTQDGFLTGFDHYWQFNGSNNLVPVANPKWVWNSQVTRYNSKGMELETRDALNIYTSAMYGFNKILPVTIANNARYNQIVNEGFEDKDFNNRLSNGAVEVCNRGQMDFSQMANSRVVSTDGLTFNAHTGKYALEVDQQTTATKSVNLTNAIDSFNLIMKPAVKNNGAWIGAAQNWAMMTESCQGAGSIGNNSLQIINQSVGINAYHYLSGIYCTPEQPYVHVIRFYAKATTSGTYGFNSFITADGGSYNIWVREASADGEIYLGDDPLNITDHIYTYYDEGTTYDPHTIYNNSFNIPMCGGKFYEFILRYVPNPMFYNGTYWPPSPSSYWCGITSYSGLPLYQNMVQQTSNCNYTLPVYGSDSLINPIFTVAPQSKMLLSAWVREDCSTPCTNYTNNKITLDFPGSGSQTLEFRPTGNIIDGWQRYESTFTVPTGSTSMNMSFVNSSTAKIYFDDIRIHPFNAQMKSYVYDPVNLKLVAELDPNNYARFYEYDEEGSLIRTKAETVEGIKTISESRSAKQRILTTIQ